MALSLAKLDREYVKRRGLYGFAELAWPIVEGSAFVPGWHTEEGAKHLEAVSRNECTRLVINQPPGTTKSLLTSVFWPVWEWTERPTTKFIFASYDQSLVNRDGEKMIKILQSDWFVERWGELLNSTSKYAVSDFTNAAGGWRFSTSIAGKATGRHGDIQCVDDPIKPIDVQGSSRKALQRVSEWWRSTMASRMRDPQTGRRVVLMQRLDEDDLAGECIRAGYTHLRLPMRYEASWPCKTKWGGDRRTVEGELLCPARFPEHVVANLEKELGTMASAAQYQQRPNPKGGVIFLEDYFTFWHPTDRNKGVCPPDVLFNQQHGMWLTNPHVPTGGIQIQSWDLTFKKTQDSDYVCGGIVWDWNGALFLMHLVNERMGFTQTCEALRKMSALWPMAYNKLVEDKANGPAVEDQLRQQVQGITLVNPEGGKEARAWASTPVMQAKRWIIPHPDVYPWVTPYMKQLLAFPRAANDDMVDMTTQAIVMLRKHGDSFAQAMANIRAQMVA